LEQLGARSQPGIATQTRPLLSNVVPQGSLPGTEYSVMLLMLDASDACASEPMLDPTARRILAVTIVNATHMNRIFLVLCFINGLDFCIGLSLFSRLPDRKCSGFIKLVRAIFNYCIVPPDTNIRRLEPFRKIERDFSQKISLLVL
jgi:hypothetical protein